MNRFVLTCAAALLGITALGCDYEPICPANYEFDQDVDVCLFVGDAGPPPVPPPDAGGVIDAGSDAGTTDDGGASDAGDTDSGASDGGADAGDAG